MKNSAIPGLPGKTKPYVLAHRGNKTMCPENTLAAFRKALSDGADIIETDLHLSADGVFMCIHDDTVDRTTGGHGKVEQMTVDELALVFARRCTTVGRERAASRSCSFFKSVRSLAI